MTQRQKRIWGSLWLVVLAALAVRLVVVFFFYHDVWDSRRNFWPFGWEAGRLARSVAEGHGFGNPLYGSTGLSAWMTPGYPYLVAAVFKLFGVYSKLSAFAVLLLNSLFSALTCIPIFCLARRSFGRTLAIWAAWAWALFPYAIYLSGSVVWENCLTTLLLTVLLLLTFELRGRASGWAGWLGYGLLWGFTALVNPVVLSLLPFFAGWALYGPSPAQGHVAPGPEERLRPPAGPSPAENHVVAGPDKRLRPAGGLYRKQFRPARWLPRTALVAAGLVAVLLPWEIRDYRDFHQLMPLRDNFWLEVWVGNNGNTLHWFTDAAHPSTSRVELAEYEQLGELRYMALKREQALDFITHHPGKFLLTSFRRFVFTWTGFWSFDPRYLAEEPFDPANITFSVPLTLLMLVGLWQAFRQAPTAALPFAFAIVFYPMVYYVTHPGLRYRDVVDPEVVILAVYGAAWLIARRRKGTPVDATVTEAVEETAGVI